VVVGLDWIVLCGTFLNFSLGPLSTIVVEDGVELRSKNGGIIELDDLVP
jgi:hypothetical protein